MENTKHIPHAPKDITKEWLETVFKKHNPDVQEGVQILEIRPVQEKTGFLSSVFKAKLRIGNDGDIVPLFIKYSDVSNEATSFVNDSSCDITEIKTYVDVFPDLMAFEKRQETAPRMKDIIPRCYGGDYDENQANRGYYLLLQDMSPEYALLDFNTGLSYEEMAVALKKMAIFHATTYAWHIKENVNFAEKYSEIINKFSETDVFEKMGQVSIEYWTKEFNLSMEERKIWTNFTCNMRRLFDVSCREENELRFLCQGDIWANNVLYNQSGTDCILLDWQFLSNYSPLWDVASMIFTGLDKDVLEANLDSLLEVYHSELAMLCEEFHVQGPWTLESFKANMMSHGLIYALCWATPSQCISEEYSRYGPRIHWIFRKCLEVVPNQLK